MSIQDDPVLYKDSKIRIEYNPESPEDHLIYIMSRTIPEVDKYHIPRGCLEELAKTNRNELKDKLNTLNDLILSSAYLAGLTCDSVGYAIVQAYIEEQERYENFAREFKRECESSEKLIQEEELYTKNKTI